jgi:hypothetical protein
MNPGAPGRGRLHRRKGDVCMAPINGKDLNVFKDMCGLHSNFTAIQLARISEIAREMKMILEAKGDKSS